MTQQAKQVMVQTSVHVMVQDVHVWIE